MVCQGPEPEEEGIEDSSEQPKPAVTLKEAKAAADIIARFMQQEPNKFSVEQLFSFERHCRTELQRMLISKFKGRKQQKISDYFML